MIKTILQFKTIVKDRLFYNRFEYAISFTLDEASCLRDLSHEEIDATIERRKEWRSIAMQRWHKTGTILGRQHILGRRRKDITEDTVKNLHTIADFLLTTPVDFKLVVSGNSGHIYANDLKFIDRLGQYDFLEKTSYTQAQINRPKDTIQLKNPKHKFRSYFKISKITDEQKRNLTNFLHNQQEYVRISPALAHWMTTPLLRTQEYFFVDHNEMTWLTMMALVRPGLVRKTQQIIQAK